MKTIQRIDEMIKNRMNENFLAETINFSDSFFTANNQSEGDAALKKLVHNLKKVQLTKEEFWRWKRWKSESL